MLFFVCNRIKNSMLFLKKIQLTVEKLIVFQHTYLIAQFSFVITRWYSVLWRWGGRSSSCFGSEISFLNSNFAETIMLLQKSGKFSSSLIFCIFLFLDLSYNSVLYLIKFMYKFWPLSYCCAYLYFRVFCVQEFNYLACSCHSNIPQAYRVCQFVFCTMYV